MRAKGWLIALAMVFAMIFGIWWFANNVRRNGEATRNLKPEISVAGVSISNIDQKKIDMTAKVLIDNPLPVDFQTNDVNYQVLINGTKVLEDRYEKPIAVKSKQQSTIEVPMEVVAKPLVEVLKQLDAQKADSADYTILATFAVDVPIAGERTFEVRETKRLPALRLPRIKTEDIDLKKLAVKNSEVRMDVTVVNPNLFPISMRDVAYDVVIGKDALKMNGSITGTTHIPAKSSKLVPIDLTIEEQKVGKLLWKGLFDKKDTEFSVNFNCKIVSKNDMLNNSKMAMSTTGTLADLKQAAENLKN